MFIRHVIAHARRNVVGYVALFVALGGVSYAAALPRNSVGSKQLRSKAVTSSKLASNAVTTSKVKDRSLKAVDFASGQLPAGATGPAGPAGPTGPAGPAGQQGETGPVGPSTGTAGGDLTGSFPNPEIAPGAVGPAEHGSVPAARVYRTTNQQTDTGGSVTVEFDGESFDTADMHTDAAPSRLTAPIAGIYLVTGNVRWEEAPGGDYRLLVIARNGNPNSQVPAEAMAGPATQRQQVTGTARLAAGDYVELGAHENAAAQLQLLGTSIGATAPAMSMVWLGP